MNFHLRAIPMGIYKGKRVYSYPVLVRFNCSKRMRTIDTRRVYRVTALTPGLAADYVRDAINRPETEVIAYGPQGGKTYRFIGWESAIGRAMANSHTRETQTRFSWEA